jgi:hypothetical protein
MVTESEANAIADYFTEHNKDPRVKVGAFDLSKVTKFEAAFGGMAYKADACLGCHVIEENGKFIGVRRAHRLLRLDNGTTRIGSSVSGRIRKTLPRTAASFWPMRRSHSFAQ